MKPASQPRRWWPFRRQRGEPTPPPTEPTPPLPADVRPDWPMPRSEIFRYGGDPLNPVPGSRPWTPEEIADLPHERDFQPGQYDPNPLPYTNADATAGYRAWHRHAQPEEPDEDQHED